MPIVDRSGIDERVARGIDPSTYLSVVAIMKDEGPYLREWIEFHRLVGVEHFVLYDNDSSDQTHDVLAPYVRQGCVEVIPWPNFLAGANAQHLAYAHAAVHLAGRARWLVTLDLDEFLFSPTHADLVSVFHEYDDLPGLGIFLRCFGPNGHEKQPDGSSLEAYLTRVPDSSWEGRQYKSAVQPELVRSVVGARRFHLVGTEAHGFDEERRPLVANLGDEHCSAKLRINHYATRSLAELHAKVARRYFGSDAKVEARREEKLQQHAKLFDCEIEDRDILRFVPALRERLARPADDIAP